jgi:hypothetical protein
MDPMKGNMEHEIDILVIVLLPTSIFIKRLMLLLGFSSEKDCWQFGSKYM